MTKVFVGIWAVALLLSSVCIAVLVSPYIDTEAQLPAAYFPPIDNAEIVFIGSSLTFNALPATKVSHGLLGDDRSSAIVSAADISAQLSNRLLKHAIDSGARTVFLEINAYAHTYIERERTEPQFLAVFALHLAQMGAEMSVRIKSLINQNPNPRDRVRIGAGVEEGTLDTSKIPPGHYYRFLNIEPGEPRELQDLLVRARNKNVEVFFFSPPRPQSAVSALGDGEFAALLSHVRQIAASFEVPLWYSTTAWSDDHFRDVLAHTNKLGRSRFQEELARWYRARA